MTGPVETMGFLLRDRFGSGGWTLAWRSLAAVASEVGFPTCWWFWVGELEEIQGLLNVSDVESDLNYGILKFFVNEILHQLWFLGDSWLACPRSSKAPYAPINIGRPSALNNLLETISSKRQMVIDGIFTSLPMSAQLLFEHGHSGWRHVATNHKHPEGIGSHTMNAWWHWYHVR